MVLAGSMQKAKGFSEAQEQLSYPVERVPVVSTKFGMSLAVVRKVLQLCRKTSFDFIMIPADQRRLPLMLVLTVFRPVFHYRLFSYNHAKSGSREAGYLASRVNQWLTRLMYGVMDRVVFYTYHERDTALGMGLLPPQKAFYANNTLDTDEIAALCPPEPETVAPPAMLFIGRLVAEKRVDLALQYYREVKKAIPQLRLIVIGDGPDVMQVKRAAQGDADILWTGMLSEEQEISIWMRQASCVFNPGRAGLSVVHAFAYGKPFVTLRKAPGSSNGRIVHAPEMCYLMPGENGLLLDGDDLQADCRQITAMLTDPDRCRAMARKAMETSRQISIAQWTEQMSESLMTRL
jgi:glycosyltransferase involved in cell wall biosynthesis